VSDTSALLPFDFLAHPAITDRMSEQGDFWREAMRQGMGQTAFLRALGGELIEFSEGRGRIRLPYAAHLVGDPRSGAVHGGVLTALLDQACGMAIGSALRAPKGMATLDLRVDHMKASAPEIDIIVEAECIKIAHEVAFARAHAFQTSPDNRLAMATGAFMLMTLGART
jgi:uncharacterized protein (TIGR00369 family)